MKNPKERRRWIFLCLLVVIAAALVADVGFSPSLRADGPDAKTASKGWRYFLREAQFNRLLLDLAGRYQPQSFIVRGATVLTMDGDGQLVDHIVVVESGRITAVAPSREVPVRAGFRKIDASGEFLVPGLVDMHVHTLTTSGDYLLDLINGVTSVRQMCGFLWLLSVREQVQKSRILAPSLYVAGTILNGFEMEWYAVVVKNPNQARELAREQEAAGYDLIKVHNVLHPSCYDAIRSATRRPSQWPTGTRGSSVDPERRCRQTALQETTTPTVRELRNPTR